MPIPLAIAVAGTAISAWNQMEAGKAEASAFKESAKARRDQAASVMERFGMNAEFTRLDGKSFKGKQLGAFASSGVDLGSGAVLSSIEDTANKINRRIQIDQMEAEASRDSILMAADLDMTRADNAKKGGEMGALGAIAGGFMRSF